MITVPWGMAGQIVKGGHFVYVRRKERKQADELILAALRESICPGGCDPEAVELLAGRIGERLAKTPLPRDERPSLRERLLVKPLRRKLPGAGDLTGEPFSERLRDWLLASTDGLGAKLETLRCGGYQTSPTAIASRFVANFHTQLVDHPSRFRTALAKELEEAESFREWRAEVKRRSAETIAATATLGLAAGGVAEVAGAGDPGWIGIGFAAFAAVSGAIRAGSAHSDQSPMREAARSLAAGWVEDLLQDLAGGEGKAPSSTSLRLWADELLTRIPPDVKVSDRLMADLASRVIPTARAAGVEGLEVALVRLEDAATRRGHGRRCSLHEPLISLLDVIGEGIEVGVECAEQDGDGAKHAGDGVVTW